MMKEAPVVLAPGARPTLPAAHLLLITAMTTLLRLASAALLAGAASAQAPLVFDIDQPNSNFDWSGTTSTGLPILGNPDTTFQVNGTANLVLGSAAGVGIDSGEFVPGGSALVTPDIAARVPGILGGTLATIDITNLTLGVTSAPFTVAPDGSFNASVVLTALSGTSTVDFLGSVTNTDLTGNTGDPTAVSGSFTQVGSQIDLNAPISTTFSFTDAGSGITATLTITGTINATHVCPAPSVYCNSNPNSSGSTATIALAGSSRVQDQNLLLSSDSLPNGVFGYYLFSSQQGFVPNFGGSQGNLCISGQLLRLNQSILNSGQTGSVSLNVPFAGLPGGATFEPGETWNFQLWFRDNVGGPTSNTSNGIAITFCP